MTPSGGPVKSGITPGGGGKAGVRAGSRVAIVFRIQVFAQMRLCRLVPLLVEQSFHATELFCAHSLCRNVLMNKEMKTFSRAPEIKRTMSKINYYLPRNLFQSPID